MNINQIRYVLERNLPVKVPYINDKCYITGVEYCYKEDPTVWLKTLNDPGVFPKPSSVLSFYDNSDYWTYLSKHYMNGCFGVMTKPASKALSDYIKADVLATRNLYDIYKIGEKMNIKNNIKEVIFNKPATIVLWKDGTKTVVKAEKERYDPEKGLAMCIAKKALGNKGNYYDIFKEFLPKEEPIDKYKFYAGKRSKIVCAGDCYHVKNIKPENRLVYDTIEDAAKDGCVLCKHCLGLREEERRFQV